MRASAEYDLLVSIPLHRGDGVIARSGMGDELDYVPVDKNTLLSTQYPNISLSATRPLYPRPRRVRSSITPWTASSTTSCDTSMDWICFFLRWACQLTIESGFGKGMLIDFNYEGWSRFPDASRCRAYFALLQESEMNHWGKRCFGGCIGICCLLAKSFSLPARMTMSGKWTR